MATIIITGGTGLIGKALTHSLLEKKHKVIILSRSEPKDKIPGAGYAKWDINAGRIDESAIASADCIVHLAGAGVADKRWTAKRKQEIIDSRVKSGELLITSLKEIPNHITTVVASSAIGWYGPDPVVPNPNPFREDAPSSEDFLGETCRKWEQSLEPLARMGKRHVTLRTGIVLAQDGGALKEFRRPLTFGLATILGTGKQVMSWVHIDDIVRLYVAAIENEKMQGIYNAVAPRPVSNKELILQLAKVKKGNFFIPIHVPAFILRMVLGEMSIEVLKSTTVSCDKLHIAGHTFLYPSIDAALQQLSESKD